MQQNIIKSPIHYKSKIYLLGDKWCKFFQGLILSKFYQAKNEALETLVAIIIGQLFGLYNPNQLADALSMKKSSLYTNLAEWSLPQWKRLLLEIPCQQALEEIQKTQTMSAATKSRRRITIAVDDTVLGRNGKCLSYCYNWFSGRVKKTWFGSEYTWCHHQNWRFSISSMCKTSP